jgi:type IV pilus assembly protein PilO
MSNKNNQQPMLLFGAVLLFLGLFAFYYFVQLPSSSKVKAQSEEISQLDKQVQLLTKKVSDKQKDNAGPSMKDVQAALPLWDNTEQLTLDLNKIKKDQNVTFSTIAYSISEKAAQPADATKKAAFPNVHEVKVTTSISGTFKEVTAAITQLQALPRLIQVDSVNYGNLPKEAARKITVNLIFTAYFDPSYKSKVEKVESPF